MTDDILHRQKQGEDTTPSRDALQLDRSTQQLGQTAADRQTQTRSAIYTAGSTFRLLEGFEDDILFLLRNADTRIVYRKGDHLPGLVQAWIAGLPVPAGFVYT